MTKRSGAKTLTAAIVSFIMTMTGVAAQESYSFGVVPQFEPRRLSEIWVPILDEIGRRAGVELRMEGSPRIPEFEVAFQNGDFDFAYMNPYHSLMAAEKQQYTPIVRDGSRQLFGVLVVAKDSPYQKVEDLAGKTIAYPAPNALGAALMMRADLDRLFGLEYRAFYASTHSSAYLNVLLGETDAAGGVMATLNSSPDDVKNNLRIIYETTRVPPHPVTVHPRVPAEVAERVRAAFLDMAATEEGQKLLAEIPMKQAVSTGPEDYYVLKELRLENYVINSGE